MLIHFFIRSSVAGKSNLRSRKSVMSIVDLAGSENAAANTGQRMKVYWFYLIAISIIGRSKHQQVTVYSNEGDKYPD